MKKKAKKKRIEPRVAKKVDVEPIDSAFQFLVKGQLDSAIAAIRHLRNVLKDYNKDHADHALSATVQYEEKVDEPKP